MTLDLDDLVEARYGKDYATHPKLRTLAQLNRMSPRYALDGKDEAEAFELKNFGAIDRSVEEKVGWIAQICRLLIDGELDTLNSVGSVAIADGRVDAVGLLLQLGRRLRDVERDLARRHDSRVAMEFNDEYDDQDLFRALLRLFFNDVRAEEWAPSYAGAASRIDFVLPEIGIALELKHARAGLTAKKVGEELIIDTTKYAIHPSVRHLVCIVIDHDGLLVNPRGLENDLARESRRDDLAVTVAIIDR